MKCLTIAFLAMLAVTIVTAQPNAGANADPNYGQDFERRTTTLPPGGTDVLRNKTRIVSSSFDFRETGGQGPSTISVTANTPRQDEQPGAWRWKVVANASNVKYSGEHLPDNGDPAAIARARANSVLAPAVALATAYSQSDGSQGPAFARADAAARARPGLQFGAVISKSDATAIGEGRTDAIVGSYSSANAGQGISISSSRAEAEARAGGIVMDQLNTANANRWYMAPGHAIGGILGIIRGGDSGPSYFTENRARADLGTATAGVVQYTNNNGFIFPDLVPTDRVTTFSSNDNAARVDAGNAAAGTINIGITKGGRVQLVNDDTSAQAAVGNAIAGSILVGVSEIGRVYLGDYDVWDDATQDSTTALTRGRGAAEAGQINIAHSTEDETRIYADVGASADQAPAIAGSFNLANSFQTASIDTRAIARTSEYLALAGNINLAQSQERSVAVGSAEAVSSIGPALAYTLSNAVIGEQDASTASATATTNTGSATALGLAQSLGGVTTESQAAAEAVTITGNALAAGSAISGSAFTAESVSSAGATSEGDGLALAGSLAFSLAADAEADSAASGTTDIGNVAAVSSATAFGAIQGKAASVAGAGSGHAGTAGALSVATATGIAQAQTSSAATAEAVDGNAQATSGSLSISGINSIAGASASASAETGDVAATALAGAVGFFHGEARAKSTSSTGCADCISDSIAQAISTGIIADSEAIASADSDANEGNALANAMAFGEISRTSNGGASRVTVGPGQALVGAFAVAAKPEVRDAAKAALSAKDPTTIAKEVLANKGATTTKSTPAPAKASPAPTRAATSVPKPVAAASPSPAPSKPKLPELPKLKLPEIPKPVGSSSTEEKSGNPVLNLLKTLG